VKINRKLWRRIQEAEMPFVNNEEMLRLNLVQSEEEQNTAYNGHPMHCIMIKEGIIQLFWSTHSLYCICHERKIG